MSEVYMDVLGRSFRGCCIRKTDERTYNVAEFLEQEGLITFEADNRHACQVRATPKGREKYFKLIATKPLEFASV